MQVTGNTVHKATHLPFDFADFLANYPRGISPDEGMALARYAETIDYGDMEQPVLCTLGRSAP